MMRMTSRLITAVLVFFVSALPLMAASPGAVYLNSVEGNVQYVSAASKRVLKAIPNKPIAQGDIITVSGPGNAEIFVRDGSVLRITEGSRLKMLSIEYKAVQFFLESGKVYVKSAGLNDYPLFLSTLCTHLDSYERSTFRVDITPSGDTEISVYSGQLSIAQQRGRMTIVAGTRLIMKKDGGAPVYTTNRQADAWDTWNRTKDGTGLRTISPQQEGAQEYANPDMTPGPPAVAYPAAPVVEYVYVAPAPVWWGYSYSYYPWGYRPYPWYGSYYRGWGHRPWYGYHHGYRGRSYGPGPHGSGSHGPGRHR